MTTTVLTVSDKGFNGQRIDTAGPAVVKMLNEAGFNVLENKILADEYNQIVNYLTTCVNQKINLVITVGGTGFSKRDITPEATNFVIERQTPGLNELMRLESYKLTNRAMLSRATSGIKDDTLIINLPGSEKAATENLSFILPILIHGLQILLGTASECASGK